MPRNPSTDHFLTRKVEVQDPDRTMVFGPGPAPGRKGFDAAVDNVVLLGLEGCGHRELARALAERLDMGLAEGLDALLGRKGAVAAVDAAELRNAGAAEAARRAGRGLTILDLGIFST